MAIKQRETTLDSILLKVVYPLLFSSSLGRRLLRRQLWHQDIISESEAPNVVELATKIRQRKALRARSTSVLGQKRAA